jgi:hypothetical protein
MTIPDLSTTGAQLKDVPSGVALASLDVEGEGAPKVEPLPLIWDGKRLS